MRSHPFKFSDKILYTFPISRKRVTSQPSLLGDADGITAHVRTQGAKQSGVQPSHVATSSLSCEHTCAVSSRTQESLWTPRKYCGGKVRTWDHSVCHQPVCWPMGHRNCLSWRARYGKMRCWRVPAASKMAVTSSNAQWARGQFHRNTQTPGDAPFTPSLANNGLRGRSLRTTS
jgi:hypothetical protein